MAQGTLSVVAPPGDPAREPDLDSIREAVAADIWARYHRLCGHAVRFVLVVADQGAEVEGAAAQRGLTPQGFADQGVTRWRACLDALGISCDELVRTSEIRHQRVAKALFLKLFDQDDVAKGTRQGNGGATACLPSRAPEEGTVGQAGRGTEPREGDGPLADAASEGYFLRVSKYGKALTQYLEDHPDLILPAECREAVLRCVEGPDPWISRARGEWGISVPIDRGQAIEGWFDGLLSHLTTSGYLTDPQAFERAWPPHVQIVAPDALPTHGAAWLALLMAMGLPLPERIVVRGRWRWQDGPLGSEGGVLGERVAGLGADPLRYAVARAADFVADGALSLRGIVELWNTEIAGRLLRLVETCLAAAEYVCGGQVPRPGPFGPAEEALVGASTGLFSAVGPLVESLDLRAALGAVSALVSRATDYAVEQGIGDPPGPRRGTQTLGTPLYVLLEVCRLAANGLRPFLPAVASAVCGRLGTVEDERPPSSQAQWGLTRPLTRIPQGESLELRLALKCP